MNFLKGLDSPSVQDWFQSENSLSEREMVDNTYLDANCFSWNDKAIFSQSVFPINIEINEIYDFNNTKI